MRLITRRAICWTLYSLVFVPLASAQDQEATNFGREAREGTPSLGRDPDKPLDERERIHHLLSRLTFGVTDEAINEVEKMGLDQWIKTQLKGDMDEPKSLTDRLAKLKSLSMSAREIVTTYHVPVPPLKLNQTPEEAKKRAEAYATRARPQEELRDTVIFLAVDSNNQFREVACDFWRNHFSVDFSKGRVRYYATGYERDVIRTEAMGRFAWMLNKQARHPAMLVFLDNYISRAPPRKDVLSAGQEAFYKTRDFGAAMEAIDIAKMKGINENYARELMELHTLGVDNYYTQTDVITVANALTGWTVQSDPEKPITFKFDPKMHASEFRVFLKTKIRASRNNPEMEGQAILNHLARHRGTAEFIAYKLCRHLVSDSPPPKMVKRVAKVFQKSKTDLPKVYMAILTDKEFYNPKHYQSKFKRPFEFVVSALRVTDAQIVNTGGIHAALVSMSEPLYECEDPTGYYDQADAWRDPGVMAPRWRFSLGLGLEQIHGVRIPDSYWEELEPNNPVQWKETLTKRILPGGCTEKTSEALDGVIAKYARYNPKPKQLGSYIVGILLGSPEFQRQ